MKDRITNLFQAENHGYMPERGSRQTFNGKEYDYSGSDWHQVTKEEKKELPFHEEFDMFSGRPSDIHEITWAYMCKHEKKPRLGDIFIHMGMEWGFADPGWTCMGKYSPFKDDHISKISEISHKEPCETKKSLMDSMDDNAPDKRIMEEEYKKGEEYHRGEAIIPQGEYSFENKKMKPVMPKTKKEWDSDRLMILREYITKCSASGHAVHVEFIDEYNELVGFKK